MHAIEKILAKNSGRAEVHTGEIVTAKVDFAEINDLYLQTVYSFYEMGGEKVWDRERAAFVFDHYAPCPDVKSAANHKEMREFAQKNGLRFHFDTNCGVCHQVMPEAGLIYPGMIVVATDSHTTTHGAFGAMGTGCGATDMATILMTGELWFRVPEIIEVRLEGETKKGVYPKDVILEVLGRIRADGAVYKAIDFTGSYVEKLNVAGRNFGCGSSREHAPIALLNMGAKAVIADSFARIFFRNAINLGLVPVICKGISKKVHDGQTLTLDFVKGVVTVQETGERYPCEALGEQAMKILAAGGIKPLMCARFAKEKAE